MSRKLFAALALAAATALPALASDRPAVPGNVPSGPPPAAGSASSHPGSLQLAPVVTLPNKFALPGEKIMSDAALMPLPDLPAGQKTWKVKLVFEGNASYLASSDEKTFTKP